MADVKISDLPKESELNDILGLVGYKSGSTIKISGDDLTNWVHLHKGYGYYKVSKMSDDTTGVTGKSWFTQGNTTFSNPSIAQTVSGITIVSRITVIVPPATSTLRLTAEFVMDLNSSNSRVYVGFDTTGSNTTNPNLGWAQFGAAVDLDNQVEKVEATIDVSSGTWDKLEPGDTANVYLMVASTSSSDNILVGKQYTTALSSNTALSGMPVIISAQIIPDDILQINPLPIAEE